MPDFEFGIILDDKNVLCGGARFDTCPVRNGEQSAFMSGNLAGKEDVGIGNYMAKRIMC